MYRRCRCCLPHIIIPYLSFLYNRLMLRNTARRSCFPFIQFGRRLARLRLILGFSKRYVAETYALSQSRCRSLSAHNTSPLQFHCSQSGNPKYQSQAVPTDRLLPSDVATKPQFAQVALCGDCNRCMEAVAFGSGTTLQRRAQLGHSTSISSANDSRMVPSSSNRKVILVG